MVSKAIFIDTQAFFSWASSNDLKHSQVVSYFQEPKTRFLTTDWVVGETVNLFVSRRKAHWAMHLFGLLDRTVAVRLHYVTPTQFQESRLWFERYRDQAFPFTDCTSFVVMRELGIEEALTADGHFRSAGFHPLLAD